MKDFIEILPALTITIVCSILIILFIRGLLFPQRIEGEDIRGHAHPTPTTHYSKHLKAIVPTVRYVDDRFTESID